MRASLGAENPHLSKTEGWGTRSSIVVRAEGTPTSHRWDGSAAGVTSGIVEYFNRALRNSPVCQGCWGLSGRFRHARCGASGVKTGPSRFRGWRIELARWLHVGRVQHSRARNGSQPEVEVARSWNAMRQAAGRRPGEQPEREQRRDSDESEKSESICSQREIALRRWIEKRKTIIESSAAPTQTPPDLSSAQPGPAQPRPGREDFLSSGASHFVGSSRRSRDCAST